MAEHPVTAGLLLVLALDLGLAAARLAIRHARLLRHDRGAELALEPLADHRDVGVAHRNQELLTGRGSFDPRRRLLLEHPLKCGAHLVEVGLGLGLDRDRQRRDGELERGQDDRVLARRQRVACLGCRELGNRTDLAGLQLSDRLLVLAVEQEQLADPLVLVAVGVPGVRLAVERPAQDPEIRKPADERGGHP